jgi:hypothetical protein
MDAARKDRFNSALASAAGSSSSGGGGSSGSAAPGEGGEGGMQLEAGQPEEAHAAAAPGFCVECGDQPHTLKCLQCADMFCDVCFAGTHRSGTRRAHAKEPAVSPLTASLPPPRAAAAAAAAAAAPGSPAAGGGGGRGQASPLMEEEGGKGRGGGGEEEDEDDQGVPRGSPLRAQQLAAAAYDISERARFIPLRLHYEERRMLRLVEAALNVSEYTDKVDVQGRSVDRGKRMQEQLKAVFAILWCVAAGARAWAMRMSGGACAPSPSYCSSHSHAHTHTHTHHAAASWWRRTTRRARS